MTLPVTAPAAAWIDHRAALEDWLAAIPAGSLIGLDTEFMRRNTFYPQLALLQLGWEQHYALVDPLACEIGDSLLPSIGQPGTITVMHSASEDLEAMSAHLPDGPGTLFDTQIAAAFAGMGLGISYRALVAELIGDELDKGETRSDWLQRPLTESQRNYAALDVVYLKAIHRQLADRLEQRGFSAWHAEDCERLKFKACHRDGDAQPQRHQRGAAEWPREQQALLRRVLIWRDASARSLDRPRPWLLEDALAMSLAQQPPASLAELDQRSRGQRALRSPQRAELFALLSEPVSAMDVAATAAIPEHPQGEAKKAVAAMKQHVDSVAGELDLPPGLLCPRKALEEYAVTRQWPELLEGWRQPLLQPRLSSLLPG